MNKITLSPGTVLLSCELDDEAQLLTASEQDFNLAQHVAKGSLELKEGVYTDKEFYYYSIERNVTVRGGYRTISKPVWIRSTIKCYPGGRWDPDEFDEVLVDGDDVFLTLSDAVKQSKLDHYELELNMIDNRCESCSGSGFMMAGYKDDDGPCPFCQGKGYKPFEIV